MDETYQCVVCGFDGLKLPPYDPATGLGNHVLCHCCLFEYGFTDDVEQFSVEEWRKRWVDAGLTWGYGPKPPAWNAEEQLASLPDVA